MFKNPFSFNGRIRRLEFGLSYIIYWIILAIIGGLLSDATEPNLGIVLLLLIYIPAFWFIIAQAAKRCHDRGNTGWFVLIPFYVFWLLFADSEIGENQYGLNPKGIGNYNEIDEIGSHL
jgi:uncharacterized membrane protein YhaH (DUF805 family)